MSNFFIDRPVFAWVIALTLMLVGGLAIRSLPVAQYPAVAPPAISITVTYPGASAETVESTVVQVIEQQMSGLDGLLYFSSTSSKDGNATITLSFAQGTNADTAQVQVQNKLALATPRLPLAVQQQGLRVAKATRNFLMVVGFVSTDARLTGVDISDFIASSVQDPLSRTAGVGDYQLFGAQYAMRIWLDPAKLNNFAMTAGDVTAAIQAQNVQVPSGELGGLPALPGQQLNATIIGPSYLRTPEQFGEILLRVRPDGSQVKLRDVARIELGGENYAVSSQYNGKPAAGIAIKLAANANALDTERNVRATVERLRPSFPAGVEAVYPYDTAPFVVLSITEVVKTLGIAIVLVVLVIFLFLQNWRATLIPALAVPVVLLGTFIVLAVAGFSINTLTMFGLVLAIGLLVDDAIVVVENVQRVMEEDGLGPREATRKSMGQITGALVGIAIVLSAVFLPAAFFGGSTGVIYRQFSITIATAMMLSVFVAVVFTPALCATLLKAPPKDRKDSRWFGWFNRGLAGATEYYARFIGGALKRTVRLFLVFALLVGGMVFMFTRLPTSFLPDEDQGVLFMQILAPPGAAADRTQRALDEVRQYLLSDEQANVESVFTVNGFSFGGRGQNAGLVFISLKDWSVRSGAQNRAQAIAGRLMGRFFGGYQDAMIFAFAPPPILELGNATGFDAQLVDRQGAGHAALMAARGQVLGAAMQNPALSAVRPNGPSDEPQYRLTIDRERASAFGITLADINTTIAGGWGTSYVADFIDRSRVKRVYIQGDARGRMLPQDLAQWFVRNASGGMVPFSAFARADWVEGSPQLERYNGISSVELLGAPAPGQSTGTAIAAMEELAKQLPNGIALEWTGLSYEEQQAGNQAFMLYGLSLLVVFLSLAALYESWAIPGAVMLAVPLGVLGATTATFFRGLSDDVYFQVGLMTTIGLASKNAILIVEFAREEYDRGKTLVEAAIAAARQRIRPILMTSIAFLLGVLPLAISTGAGSGGQNAIGTAVVGGMMTDTFLVVLFVPGFFVTVLGLLRVKRKSEQEAAREQADREQARGRERVEPRDGPKEGPRDGPRSDQKGAQPAPAE